MSRIGVKLSCVCFGPLPRSLSLLNLSPTGRPLCATDFGGPVFKYRLCWVCDGASKSGLFTLCTGVGPSYIGGGVFGGPSSAAVGGWGSGFGYCPLSWAIELFNIAGVMAPSWKRLYLRVSLPQIRPMKLFELLTAEGPVPQYPDFPVSYP